MPATRTARLNVPANTLRRGDRIANLAPGMIVVAFDLTIGETVVDVYPSQAGLDAGAQGRYTVDAGELLIIEREIGEDGLPAQPAVVVASPVVEAPAVNVPALVASFRATIARDPELFDGVTDLVMWLVEATAHRTWTPSELARALKVGTGEVANVLPILLADGYIDGDDRGAWTRYTARRR